MQLGDFGSALSDVVVHFGYGAVFVLVFLESAGIPLPGETALVTASALAATTGGLDISLIITAAATGAILGDNLGFWVGHRYGFAFLRRYGRYVRLSEDRIMICQWLFRLE
jgi:membrane protein DedA with SNARE-associated domain